MMIRGADRSLLRRSAFVVTVVILVASQVRDGSGRPSILTSRCRQHAEDMGEPSLRELRADSQQDSPCSHPCRRWKQCKPWVSAQGGAADQQLSWLAGVTWCGDRPVSVLRFTSQILR